MRIAYVAKGNFASGAGVLRKIDGQTAEWRAAGHSTQLFALTTAPTGNAEPNCPSEFRYAGGWTSRWSSCRQVVRHVAEWQPDIIYLRQCSYQPQFRLLFNVAPVVIEVNADDTKELRLVSRVSHMYNLATRASLLRRACAFVFVTHELAESPSFAKFRQPRLVIGNGIALDDVVLRTSTPISGPKRLFFIGSPDFSWHGVDKLAQLASMRPTWHFDLVGLSSRQADNLPVNVTAHGHLREEEYAGLLAGADVAVASLAMHRDGLEEASPLKTREYLATGVPVLMAYRDTDYLGGAPFILRLPNTEGNVPMSLASIDAFVEKMRGVVVPRARTAHLDWSRKEPARIALFERMAKRSRGD